jgi:WD40 repeat protein
MEVPMRAINWLLVLLLVSLGGLAGSTSEPAAGVKLLPPGVDLYGDPLPAGAVARLGTVRFRNGSSLHFGSISPDGKLLASADGKIVRLWDADTGKEIRQFHGHQAPVRCLAYSSDGKAIASGSDDKNIRLWDAASGRELAKCQGHQQAGPSNYPLCVAQVIFAPDGKTLVSHGSDQTIRQWDAATGKELRQFKGHKDHVWSIGISRDGKRLAAFVLKPFQGSKGSGDFKPGEVWVWDYADGKKLHHWFLTEDLALAALSPDLKILVTCLRSGLGPFKLKLWEVNTGKYLRSLPVHSRAVAFTADSKKLWSARENYQLWDLAGGKELRRVKNPHYSVFSQISLSPDSKTIVSWGFKNTIELCDVETGKELRAFVGHDNGIRAMAFSPDGKYLASGQGDEIRLWDLATYKQMHRFPGHVSFLTALTFSPDARKIISSSANNAIHVWDAATGKEHHRPKVYVGHVTQMALSLDGTTLVTIDGNRGAGTLNLWQTKTWKLLDKWELPEKCWTRAFSPDRKILATSGGEKGRFSILLWDVKAGKLLASLGPHPKWVTTIAFSPDGRLVAGVSSLDTIHVWEIASGQQRLTIHPDGNVHKLAFSPDSRLLAIANSGGFWRAGKTDGNEHIHKVRLWDLSTGRETQRFGDHRSAVTDIAFSPNGRLLASASWDTTILLWDVAAVGPGAKPMSLEARRLEALWTGLAGDDGFRAHKAIWSMAAAPAQTLPFLKARLKPVAPADQPLVARLVVDLDSDIFAVRQKATRELEKLGASAKPALHKVVAGSGASSLEFRRRLERLLATPAEKLSIREGRAVEVLEHIANGQARQLLQSLADGVADANLTKEAQAAIARLDKAAK